ncbi:MULTISPECIES: class I SAM-dependent methyltransferase family protein [Halobacterium]|uniref:class I SAM-dependent methyltransferase n=1 Tax=Halobacterium TaxID=2239 RepID=UPI00073F3EC1|nr:MULTISPECIES: class I SAM-dependent methyltransferase family protein [Halobacterium]MCG1003083.1 class I SAM-dependent methyltransferase family protein [Halobacterium noricense]
MSVPCVRVPTDEGEATRRRLADENLVVDEYAITASDGDLYIPVSDAEAVPEDLEVVEFDVPERETPTTPAEILGFEPSYERLGDVVIIDEDDTERAREIADAVMKSDVRAKTVVNRASKVKGTERVRDWDVVAGNGTETVHTEYGCEFELDLATVYFSPRLATERHRVVEQVERAAERSEAAERASSEGQSPSDRSSGRSPRENGEGRPESHGEHAFDMFAGVGPYAVPMAEAGAEVVATDINEDAVDYLRRNAERNGVSERVTAIAGNVRDVAGEYENWADRIVMNLPHTADEFLDTAVALAGDDCVIHFYDFQHEDDLYTPCEAAIREAAEPEYDVTIENERTVRSYAPHELNVVVDARLTRR